MPKQGDHRVYDKLGVRPVINATGGNRTLLGGSILSPEINQAMQEANRYYVDMEELLDRTGSIIAELLDTEAALVTPGCCAALALGTAACMAGGDPAKAERLPDVSGMKHEVIVQRSLRSKYDRCVTVPGGRLVEVGDHTVTRAEEIEEAIGDRTAAIHYLAPGKGAGVVPLEAVVDIGKRHGIPIVVDAAGQVYPVENMKKYMAMGADLVGFGAKYFGAPNSSGILCGRKDLVQAASLHGFIGFEVSPYRAFGRPMKLDRQEIVAVVVALQEWLTMDHDARFETYGRRVANLRRALEGVTSVKLASEGSPVTGLRVVLDEKAVGKTAAEVASELQGGNPSIWVEQMGDTVTISVKTLVDGDEVVVSDSLRRALAG